MHWLWWISFKHHNCPYAIGCLCNTPLMTDQKQLHFQFLVLLDLINSFARPFLMCTGYIAIGKFLLDGLMD